MSIAAASRVRIGGGAVLLGLMLALTGCARYDMDAQVHRDDTVSGTFILAVEHDNVVKVYGSEQQFLDTFRTELENSTGAGGTAGIVPTHRHRGEVELSPYRSGTLVGYRQKFTGISITDLNPKAITIRHRDSRFIVDINVDFLDTELFRPPTLEPTPAPSPRDTSQTQRDLENRLRAQNVDPGLVLGDKAPKIQVRFSFPGKIISTNGRISGRSVTWQLILGKQKTLHASAWDEPERSRWWLYVIGIVIGIGPAFLLMKWLWRNYRRWREHRRLRPKNLPPEPEKIDLGFEGLPTLEDPDTWDEPNAKRSASGEEGPRGEDPPRGE